MVIEVGQIMFCVKSRMKHCTEELFETLMSCEYEVKTTSEPGDGVVVADKEYHKDFSFHSFGVMRRILKKCELLEKASKDVINPEFFDVEEQMQLSKAILSRIAEGSFKANSEFCKEFCYWVFQLGMPRRQEPEFDWSLFDDQVFG